MTGQLVKPPPHFGYVSGVNVAICRTCGWKV